EKRGSALGLVGATYGIATTLGPTIGSALLNFVGNENWGCGGHMTPEYYANEYRRYQTYLRNYDAKNPIAKIACGANSMDYDWTDQVLKTVFTRGNGFMNGLSLHYYTVPGGEGKGRGSATDFTEKTWYKTLKKTLEMETLIRRHGAIMDQYDPEKKIGMVIDEWGTWYDVEPGTNPGFLYQQNSMRDALVAGINLNLFHKNCDRVKMANIAQMVNVLQSVILTEGDQMILTPTYYVFHMYRNHQDGELLDSHIDTSLVGLEEEYLVPNLTESVSMDCNRRIHITLTNLSLKDVIPVESLFAETKIKNVKGTILAGKMDTCNTFDRPNEVCEQEFSGCTFQDNRINFAIPPCSVLQLEVETEAED
ncbi:MAG: alpha-L-arabinofuranosidase C-terminal domain-containing protein, partial [Lachnospiraceae bacterium]